MRRVLVTGASGFVGRHLCPALVQAGYSVRAVYVEPEPPQGWHSGIEWQSIDNIDGRTDWTRALESVSHVVHLAAIAHRHPTEEAGLERLYQTVNVEGTACLASAMNSTHGVKRLLFMSSIGAVCSLSDSPVDESTPCSPDTPYGRSKLEAERSIAQLLPSGEPDWCVFRPALLYGPRNPGNMARLQGLLRLRLPLPFGRIRNQRQFLYIGNLVDAVLLALEKPQASRQVFCLSDDESFSTPELVRCLARHGGHPAWLFPAPEFMLRGLGLLGDLLRIAIKKSFGMDSDSISRLSGSLQISSAKAKRLLGWRPPFTAEDGIRLTMQATNV